MPTITANNCQMFYEIDDFTDPWVKDKETVWLQHGVGRSTKFCNYSRNFGYFPRGSHQGTEDLLGCPTR